MSNGFIPSVICVPIKKPFPRTSFTIGRFQFPIVFLMYSPASSTRSRKFGAVSVSSTARPAAQASGFPANADKLVSLRDLLESTSDRVIIFYNFVNELTALTNLAIDLERPISILNGDTKDLTAYENSEDSVILIQYQAGAMGLNLQKANKIVYFTPPLSSELFEQSKKRIHRIGQNRPCFYYYLTCKNSIEEKIYKTLAMRKDYTERLFEND